MSTADSGNPTRETLGFSHRLVPATAESQTTEPTTLLLLHGTGGDENDLLPLGRALLPGAALLSPRGKVSEHGALRFFRRIRAGVFDQQDLSRRTEELAAFVSAACAAYSLSARKVVAVGFSNGANIAGSLLLRRPELLHAAVLLSPMVPFEPELLPDLREKRIFIGAGRADQMVPPQNTEHLAALLRRAGADVTIHWDDGGHAVTDQEVAAAAAWLSALDKD